MKSLLTFLMLLLALPVFGVMQTNVTFTLTDFSLSVATNRVVILTPESMPSASSGSTITGDKVRYVSNSNGVFTVSTMQAGVYLAEVQGPPSTTRFRVYVPSGNLTTNAHELLTATATATFPAGSVAWSVAVTDRRYPLRSEVSTNAFSTNIVGDIAASLRTVAPIGTNAGAPVFMVTNSGGQIVGFINTNAFSGGSSTGEVSTVQLNAASNVLVSLSYLIGTQSTNYTLAASNTLWAATSARQGGSQVLSNAANTGVFTNGMIAGSNVILTTNGAHQVVVTASLSGGSASLGDVTNIVSDLTGPSQSNFVNSARLAGSNYIGNKVLQDFDGQGFYKGTNMSLLSTWNHYLDYDTAGAGYSGNLSWRMQRTNVWSLSSYATAPAIDPDHPLVWQRTGLGVTTTYPMQLSSSNLHVRVNLVASNRVRFPALTNHASPANLVGQSSDGTLVQVTQPTGLSTNANQFGASSALTIRSDAAFTNSGLYTPVTYPSASSAVRVEWTTNVISGIFTHYGWTPVSASFVSYNLGEPTKAWNNVYASQSYASSIYGLTAELGGVKVTNGLSSSVFTNTSAVYMPGLSTNPAPVSYLGKLASGEVVETATPAGGAGSSNYVALAVGTLTVTNTLDVGQVTATNLMLTFASSFYATNGLAVTNLIVDANRASSHWIVTNAYTLTNWSGFNIPTNQANVTIRVEAELVNRAVTYPTFGGNSYGIRFLTNANSTLWTTHTAGVVHVYSFSSWGTNIHATVTAWK